MSAADAPVPAGATDGPAPVIAPVLQVSDLQVKTAHTTLLHDMHFTLGAGERLGIIGESGSGKSLTVLSAMGLLPDGLTAEGSVRLSGCDHDLVGATEAQMARIRGQRMSMVFQEPMTALNPLMRVGAQVAEVMLLHGKHSDKRAAAADAVEMLRRVRIPDPQATARAYPHQLSGGQRQRVMLAMALSNDPAVLICDEPTTALDVTVQEQMLDLIREGVADHDAALLFITHDLAVVASVCDRVLVLHDGRIVEEGPVARVFTTPEHPYTQSLLAASDLESGGRGERLRNAGEARTAAAPSAPAPSGVAPSAGAPSTTAAHGRPGRAAHAAEADEGDGPLITVRGVERSYRRPRTSLRRPAPEVRALRGIDLDIHAGQRFGIVGESGSGKSTLIRLIAGLDQPTAGSIRFAGQEIAGRKERDLTFLRRDLQMVFQDPMGSLDPRMRVQDVIAEPLVAQGAPAAEQRARVAELLEAVRLPADAATRYPHQFSGGQRQRISIARALSVRPRVLVADEAVSALDVSVRAQILDLITDLVEQYGLTLIFVSHDLSVIRHVCDAVAVMRNGVVVESGATEQVYTHPAHAYTQELLAAVPTLERSLRAHGVHDSQEVLGR
ncbi:dipeptide ABC transporter ATP-binding protein [Patulibacter americanus]|uniref:dipeptide ABC transporter ATP-binding protein n=1 Tax=Patulibacter americanus TaxID=588672 RepID=UPI0003B39591|nr:ABC transporter ATP-binding protein [Patulibacter americanus]